MRRLLHRAPNAFRIHHARFRSVPEPTPIPEDRSVNAPPFEPVDPAEAIEAVRETIHAQIDAALRTAAEKNGLLAEDGHHNVTQTITDGINKGISDGPDRDHHEPGEHIPCTLPIVPNTDAPTDDGIHQLDLGKVITAEFDDDQWLIEPIIPAHRAVALYAAGKTGKSLLVLDIVAAAASGRPILGGAPLETPIHILYIDQEMTQPDLQERLHDLGYDTPDETLTKHLHYYQLAPWPPLDTSPGGQRLLEEARKIKAQLVVIDTLIRTVSGEENSADTIKDFNRYTGTPLKAAGIALLRIDHAGKDLTRGQRGTSAKRDDVDVVWLLMPARGGLPGKTMLTLKREAARVDWIQQDIHITRNEGPPLSHVIPSVSELTDADIKIVNTLKGHGIWRYNVTNQSAREALNHSTLKAKGTRLAHIVRWMKRYGDDPQDYSESGKRAGTHTLSSQGKRAGKRADEKGNTQVREGKRKGRTGIQENQGEGHIVPPRGTCFPPKNLSKRKNFPSHGNDSPSRE